MQQKFMQEKAIVYFKPTAVVSWCDPSHKCSKFSLKLLLTIVASNIAIKGYTLIAPSYIAPRYALREAEIPNANTTGSKP